METACSVLLYSFVTSRRNRPNDDDEHFIFICICKQVTLCKKPTIFKTDFMYYFALLVPSEEEVRQSAMCSDWFFARTLVLKRMQQLICFFFLLLLKRVTPNLFEMLLQTFLVLLWQSQKGHVEQNFLCQLAGALGIPRKL